MAGRFYLEMIRIFGELPNKALARALGVDPTSIIQWKRGAEPSRDTIKKICQRKGWRTADEYDRLNRIAEGIPEEDLSGNEWINGIFRAFAGHSMKNFSPEDREKILQLRTAYIDAIWEATPVPATQEEMEKEIAEAYARGDMWEGPEEPEPLNPLSIDQNTHIKTLKAEIKKRDTHIASLEAEIAKLKAQIGGDSKLAPAVRVRRKK